MSSHQSLKISAKKIQPLNLKKIYQCDIFENIEVIESLDINGSKLDIKKIIFPYVICLNQSCDLENDFNADPDKNKNSKLLHLAVAPVFLFEKFLIGQHWGDIFDNGTPINRGKTDGKSIINNEVPRYHYLKFPDSDMPELIIDFKHFFSINRNFLYNNISKRHCSMDDLFRENISQRFSNYISRIGLPEHII